MRARSPCLSARPPIPVISTVWEVRVSGSQEWGRTQLLNSLLCPGVAWIHLFVGNHQWRPLCPSGRYRCREIQGPLLSRNSSSWDGILSKCRGLRRTVPQRPGYAGEAELVPVKCRHESSQRVGCPPAHGCPPQLSGFEPFLFHMTSNIKHAF